MSNATYRAHQGDPVEGFNQRVERLGSRNSNLNVEGGSSMSESPGVGSLRFSQGGQIASILVRFRNARHGSAQPPDRTHLLTASTVPAGNHEMNCCLRRISPNPDNPHFPSASASSCALIPRSRSGSATTQTTLRIPEPCWPRLPRLNAGLNPRSLRASQSSSRFSGSRSGSPSPSDGSHAAPYSPAPSSTGLLHDHDDDEEDEQNGARRCKAG